MKGITLLALAALIGVCACAYLRESDDLNEDAIEERERRDAEKFADDEDEDLTVREKRRVLRRRKMRRRKPDATPFIMGGVEVTPNQFPMMVSIQAWGSSICAGVLIHPRWVLTAAHCLGDPWDASDLEVEPGFQGKFDRGPNSTPQPKIGGPPAGHPRPLRQSHGQVRYRAAEAVETRPHDENGQGGRPAGH
ncbi:hypothetical protein NP493_127g03000 [Ridgeia piscesae]|uniref:Peptidase S1 domain-containing protein n=1 Tax=Ridgeia piscesae TaxID=27915 RepID=A0AAD9P5N9_RIDPI|nr:hypothetical protein NP493_127g03000 [Ridgeia piscesae]